MLDTAIKVLQIALHIFSIAYVLWVALSIPWQLKELNRKIDRLGTSTKIYVLSQSYEIRKDKQKL